MDSSKIKIFIIVLVIAVVAGAGGYFLRSGGENLKGSFTTKPNDLLSQQKKQQNEKLLSGSYLPKRNLPSICALTYKGLFVANGSPDSQAKGSSFQDLYKYIQNDSGGCSYIFTIFEAYGVGTSSNFFCEKNNIDLSDNNKILCHLPFSGGYFEIRFFPTTNRVTAIYTYSLVNAISTVGVFNENDPDFVGKTLVVGHYVK